MVRAGISFSPSPLGSLPAWPRFPSSRVRRSASTSPSPRSAGACGGSPLLEQPMGDRHPDTLRLITLTMSGEVAPGNTYQDGTPVCLYSLAMAVRGELDGSSEGCLPWSDIPVYASYIMARLDRWGRSRCESEARFKDFLRSVVEEAHAAQPELLDPCKLVRPLER